MKDFGLRFHHLGLATREPAGAGKFLKGLGYEIGEIVHDPAHNVNVAICTCHDKPDVELVTPSEGEGPLDNILECHDSLIYHTCYVSEDVQASLAEMDEAGHRAIPLSAPKKAVLFGGRKVSFYAVKGFGVIEIIDDSPEERPETGGALQ